MAEEETDRIRILFQNCKKGERDKGNNGNTVTTQKNNQDPTQSGFDSTAEQEAQNVICTHPGENATCTQDGITSAPQISTQQPTITSVSGQGEGLKLYKDRTNNRLVAGRKSKTTRLKLQVFELDSKAVKEINDKKYGISQHHISALS